MSDELLSNLPENSSINKEISAALSHDKKHPIIAIEVDGEIYDLAKAYDFKEKKINFITTNDVEKVEEIIRHDAAHVLAEAVKSLFPDVQVTIGPVIENGFYYDFSTPKPFHESDLELIEAKMKELIDQDNQFERIIWSKEKAIKHFTSIGELYKVEIIKSIPDDQEISVYKQGEFLDLCRGPHGLSTSYLKHFKLTRLAGAYWRGDSKNEMLQRVYGTAWLTQKRLDEYLYFLEEAAKRDHRKIGKELHLFHLQDDAPGMVFWHDKGYTIWRIIENYIRDKISQYGYQEVKTPILLGRKLWEESGHWEKFGQNMFTSEVEKEVLALKPMNCPAHVQIFNQGTKSYKDLPLRIAEFGSCHRHEPSGSLHGILRVRGFTQDDAHIFCTEEQVADETLGFCNLLIEVYKDFGFENIKIKFSDRPNVRAGNDAVWDKAEAALKDAIALTSLGYELNPGEGAFYGPKLEFVLKDAMGRDWQLGTLQLDFVLPERLDANYISPSGQKIRPVMIHRAIIGTFERFIGVLLEHYNGALPLWLSPIQVCVAGVTNDVDDYAKFVYDEICKVGIRCSIDISPDKIGYKIRNLSTQKIPFIAIVGKAEADDKMVSVRKFGTQNNANQKMELMEFINYVTQESQNKGTA